MNFEVEYFECEYSKNSVDWKLKIQVSEYLNSDNKDEKSEKKENLWNLETNFISILEYNIANRIEEINFNYVDE